MPEAMLRDSLAAERTHLANERTLLAYIRTALALAGAGAVLLHFFPDLPELSLLAWALVIFAGCLGVAGAWRFLAVRRRINSQAN